MPRPVIRTWRFFAGAQRRCLPWCWFAAVLAATPVILAGNAGAQTIETLKQAPLVLQDNRIALVGTFAIPFEPGSHTLAPATRRELRDLVARRNTDCFLSAQAIGHADPRIDGADSTIEAHGKAKERASAIADILVADGLPSDAVATVWDWQLAVGQPRVTLWLFSLAPGDGCEDKPTTPALAAAPVEPLDAGGSADPPGVPASDDPPGSAGREESGAAHSEDAVPLEDAAPLEDPASGDGLPEPSAAPSDLVLAAVGTADADDPSGTAKDEAGDQAEDQADVLVAAMAPDDAPAAGEAAIVFDVNSSFPPRDARQTLRTLLEGHDDAAAPLQLEMRASVGGSVRDATPEQARTYNLWMAERRIDRLIETLERIAPDVTLEIERGYLEEDEGRRVLIRTKP